ncbi:hypothetical protein ABVK25_010626 [Lepraria finkii]|uniref:Uncharacterized protein n=1 Tax=Lepraria finkii TaxID=1340010 RepID=A0ABR4AWU3_9LECA
MVLTLVQSPFYANPPQRQNAPKMGQDYGRSRAIDIVLVLNTPGNPRISDVSAEKFTTARELEQILIQPLLGSLSGHHDIRSLDRVYYENNWQYARSLLCRRYIKDVPPDHRGVYEEDPDLMRFELFLNAASKRNDLSFISRGTSTSSGKMVASKDRVLYHFGFDWLGIITEPTSNTLMKIEHNKGLYYLVRRTTAIAIVIRVGNTDHITASPLCPRAWTSTNALSHRRTVILFNELHSSDDGLPFTAWISPVAPGIDLWDIPANLNSRIDTESTALAFIQRLVARIWQGVVADLESVIDECSQYIIYSEQIAFHDLDVNALERVARSTWQDMLTWHLLEKLITAQRNSVSETRTYMQELIRHVNIPDIEREDPLALIIDTLAALEKTVAEDFRSKCQSISDLTYNIINVRQAQAAQKSADAAQQEAHDLGRITWITFIFFPLIAVSGVFGMNVSILINNPPSIKWYFIVGISFAGLVLGVAFFATWFNKRLKRV